MFSTTVSEAGRGMKRGDSQPENQRGKTRIPEGQL